MKLQVINSGKCSAIGNMDKDHHLLHSLKDEPRTILHLYDWQQPSFTHGHFIKPEEFLNLDVCRDLGFDWAKRPTGGGILFHVWDFTFSFLIPSNHPCYSVNTLDNYRFINALVEKAISVFLNKNEFSLLQCPTESSCKTSTKFCMAHPTEFDILFEKKKVGGAAQRRTHFGLLHQGTISLFEPDFSILRKLVKDASVIENMKANGGILFSSQTSNPSDIKLSFEQTLISIFNKN